MIIDALFAFMVGFLAHFIELFPAIPDWHVSEMHDALVSFGLLVSPLSYVFPLDTAFTIFVLKVNIYALDFFFAGLSWVLRKIPLLGLS